MALSTQRRRFAIAALVLAALAIAAYVMMRSGADRHDGSASSGAGEASGAAADREGPGGRAGRRGGARDVQGGAELIEGVPVVVEGTVRDAFSGAAVAAVDIEFGSASPSGRGPEYSATSAADGSYRVELTSGAWNVRARGDGLWSQPLRLVIAPAPGGAPVGHDVLVERAARITGRVLSARGTAIPGASVSVESDDRAVQAMLDDTTGRTVTADGAGRFALSVPAGEARLHAEATAGDGTPITGFALVPALAPGAALAVDIVCADGVTVSGVVLDGNESPVPGASVSVVSKDEAVNGVQKLAATSDAGGHFRVAGVHAGALIVEAWTDTAASAAVSVQAAAGEPPAEVLLTLEDSLPLTGTIVDSTGEPMADVKVMANRWGSYAKLPSVITGADGAFAFPAAIAGKYNILASRGAAQVRIPVENTGAPVSVVLATPGGIRGTVKGGATGLSVSIESFVPAGASEPARPALASASFPGDGTFALPGLAPGRYDLLVGARDHAATRVPGVVVGEGAWAEISVELDGGARLTGTVRDADGPVAGARVTVEGGRVAYTDAAGRFAIDAVPLGPVTLTVADGAHPAAERSAVVGADGATVAIELTAEGRDVEGVGVLLREKDAAVTVASLLRGAPAAGQVPAGATIVSVDGVAVTSVAGALARIRGAAGTQVTLTLAQGDRRWDVTLTRARVPVGANRPNVA